MNAGAHEEKAPSLGEVTGAAVFVIGLISAWLYVAGWTYAYHYFDRFGIPLLMVEIPKEHYFVYGGVVVQQFPVSEFAIAVIAIAAIALWHRLGLSVGRLRLPFGLFALLALFW